MIFSDIPENPDKQTCQHPKFGGVDCNTIPDKIEKEANDRSDNSESIQFIQGKYFFVDCFLKIKFAFTLLSHFSPTRGRGYGKIPTKRGR